MQSQVSEPLVCMELFNFFLPLQKPVSQTFELRLLEVASQVTFVTQLNLLPKSCVRLTYGLAKG